MVNIGDSTAMERYFLQLERFMEYCKEIKTPGLSEVVRRNVIKFMKGLLNYTKTVFSLGYI